MSLMLAKVVKAYPGGHSVDLLFYHDGSRASNVQVMAPVGATTNTGEVNMIHPETSKDWDYSSPGTRDIKAVVGFAHGLPVVVGFLYPQVSQMLFEDKNRYLKRHSSDVYTTIDDAGNTEIHHPSGTYLRIGSSPAHEDLTGKDYDKKWSISKNTSSSVHVQLTVANGGAVKATVNIDPSGNVTVQHEGNLSVHTKGTASVTVDGAATVKAASLTLDAPTTHITGQLNVDGNTAFAASVTAGGHAIDASHKHTGVTPGGGITGVPV